MSRNWLIISLFVGFDLPNLFKIQTFLIYPHSPLSWCNDIDEDPKLKPKYKPKVTKVYVRRGRLFDTPDQV